MRAPQRAAADRPSADGGWLETAYARLTQREREVTALLRRGLGTGAIAAVLVISPRTVHKHIENIFAKLAVTNRQELLVRLMVPPSETKAGARFSGW